MGKIVNGIDLDTGEIVDSEANDVEDHEFEEVEVNPKREENVKLISYIWPKDFAFDTDTTGFIYIMARNWHAGIEVPVSLKFEFVKKKLFVFVNGSKHQNIYIETNMILDIDKLKEGIEVIQVPKGTLMYKRTFNFRARTIKLGTDHINLLQHKLYKLVMMTKMDAQIYSRLDAKVLVGESLIERVIEKKPTHVITDKNGEKTVYYYQSVLEEKTPKQIAALI